VFDIAIWLDVTEALVGVVGLIVGGVARYIWDLTRHA
jgi:hypothetical protein